MIQVMSGTVTLLLLMSFCQVFANDGIEPPQDLNLTVYSPGMIVLTWKSIQPPQNKSVKYLLRIITPEKKYRVETTKNYYTRMVAVHLGVKAEVVTQISDEQGAKKSMPALQENSPYPGVEGTSATNLSCHIDIDVSEKTFLNCTWTPGEKAPADTEYNLFYRKDDVTERCQDYVTEPAGKRQTGCRILSSNISIKKSSFILVHINGKSKSLQIKAVEKIFMSGEIERIPPVQNVTVDVDGLHWMKPVNSLTNSCFEYEVNIWSKSTNETITVGQTSYSINAFKKATNRQFIRVRALGKPPCWYDKLYSAWTDTVHFGEDDRSDILGIIVPVCLIVACIVTFLLCVRFWRHIFPDIPKPKSDLKSFQNVQSQALMRCNSLDNEEVISYIEELAESDKYMLSLDYGHMGNYSSSGLCKSL